MSDEEKDYTAAGKAVVEDKRAEIRRTKELAEAMKQQIKRAHKAALQDEETLTNIRQEILNGVRGRTGGSAGLDEIRRKLKGGEGTLDDVEPDAIVGNEDPYWLRDDD